MQFITHPLYLDANCFCTLLELQGPSLGFWRAAEGAALSEQAYPPPVLDLGCGDGLVTSLVLPKVQIGLDPDRSALGKAEQRGIYTQLIGRPAETCQVPSESIATVISNSVLEHIPDLETVLLAVQRMLQPGGRLIFTAPTQAFSAWLALPSARYASWRNRQFEHLNLWSWKEWRCRLETAGFEVEIIRPYLKPHWVALWDWLELLQQVRVGRHRLAATAWKRIPAGSIKSLADWASQIDLSSEEPGGGRLIVARKRG